MNLSQQRFFAAIVVFATLPTKLAAQNVTTTGGKADHLPKFSNATAVVDSSVTEIGGKVGIGVSGTPSSTLTVNGMIQSLTGGIKFPDNTVQATAGISAVKTDAILSGAGTTQSPLGVALPFRGSAAALGAVFVVRNSSTTGQTFGILGSGWGGILGGGSSYGVEGIGFTASGGNGGTGGKFTGGDCGVCTSTRGGDGLTAAGGNATAGPPGDGISAQGGTAGGAFDVGGIGVYAQGGDAPGSGGQGGVGIVAVPGKGIQGTYAGFFLGDVRVTGNLSKAGGSFQIDHPLDPQDKYLYHSFVESPDMMNIYNGNVTTDGSGIAIVTLPDWFEALNRDFRYQLTVIGQFAQAIIASKIDRNQFVIRTDKSSVEVSWQVTGIRHDAWAEAHRIPVEVEKNAAEKGHYLHPELFGREGETAIGESLVARKGDDK